MILGSFLKLTVLLVEWLKQEMSESTVMTLSVTLSIKIACFKPCKTSLNLNLTLKETILCLNQAITYNCLE